MLFDAIVISIPVPLMCVGSPVLSIACRVELSTCSRRDSPKRSFVGPQTRWWALKSPQRMDGSVSAIALRMSGFPSKE